MKNIICYSILVFIFIGSTMIAQQDWPNFARYKDENLKLGSLKPGEDRVVFMGNSITEGWKDINPDFFKDNPIDYLE